ncbi:hypothetical protein O0L34_g7314 [Tuta absoluta]|nr:hypothetical protein O0L34_g7314 [Tuta absoluta]
MELAEGKLPTEIAHEPVEEARLSQGDDNNNTPSMAYVKHRKGITFAEATQSTENCSQASAASYKDVASQPAANLSHRERLLWLQERRKPGLWAQCDECDKWRFLAQVLDKSELPARWRCAMNKDKSAADCSVPEAPLRLRDEDDLIHSEYTAGSLVLARLSGWPWWPAMVDDDPDTEQYYWIDGFSDIPTHYNVVFFDAFEVTRAWIAPQNLKPYVTNKKMLRLKDKKYKKRLEVAVTQADDAEKLPLNRRLAKFSFVARYPGNINSPRHVTKHELEKYQKILKRKYNVDFPDEEPIDVDATTTVIKKGQNVLLVGTPKSKKEMRRKNIIADMKKETNKSKLIKETNSQEIDDTNVTEVVENFDDAVFKQPDSLVAHVGSNVTSTVIDISFDNDTSATYAPDSQAADSYDHTVSTIEETIANVQKRAVSPTSDDFDF